MRSRKHLILALPLAALAIAGCGGGGDDDSTTAPVTTTEAPAPLSKEELLQQGDAICAEVNAAIGGVAASEAEIPEQTIQTADLYVGMVDSLQDLGEPEDTAGGYPEFITAAEALSQIEGEIKLAAERGDTGALGEAATEATPLLEEFRSTASAYGFESCSEGPSAPVAAGNSEESVPGEEEVAPEEIEEEAAPEEAAPEVEEEVTPETGGAGGGAVAPEEGGGTESGGGSGGIGPG